MHAGVEKDNEKTKTLKKKKKRGEQLRLVGTGAGNLQTVKREKAYLKKTKNLRAARDHS